MEQPLSESYHKAINSIDSTVSIEERVFRDFEQDKKEIDAELMGELSSSVQSLNKHASVFISQYEEKIHNSDGDLFSLYSVIKEISEICTDLLVTYRNIRENSTPQTKTELLAEVNGMRDDLQSKKVQLEELRTEDTVTLLNRADISYTHRSKDENAPSINNNNNSNNTLHRWMMFFNVGVHSSLIILAMFIIALYQLFIQVNIIGATAYLLAIGITLLFRKYVLPYITKVVNRARHKIANYTN